MCTYEQYCKMLFYKCKPDEMSTFRDIRRIESQTHSRATLMPSAHGPIFCRKELREKVGVKFRFFSRSESAHTTDFLSQTAPRKNRTKSQYTRTYFFIGTIVCVNSRRCLIVGSPRFFIGLKSAHTDRFFVVSNFKKRSERFYIRAKVSAHEPILIPIFCLLPKIGPCALGIKHFGDVDSLPKLL